MYMYARQARQVDRIISTACLRAFSETIESLLNNTMEITHVYNYYIDIHCICN